MTDQQLFQNSLDSLELSRPKDRDHLIPPIIPLAERNESEIEDNFQPTTPSILFGASDSMPPIGQPNSNSAFHSVGPTPNAIMSSGANAATVHHPILSSVGSYTPTPINTMTPCMPFVTSQSGWPMPPGQSVPALPSAATMPVATSTHNPAIVIESPQLHAALTMNCLPAQHFADPYSNFLNHHHQGVSGQPANFIPFPPIPVGIHGMNPDTQGTIQHSQHHIEISEIRSPRDRSGDKGHHSTDAQQPAAPSMVEEHDNMVSSTSALSSPERQLTPLSSSYPPRPSDTMGAVTAESDISRGHNDDIPLGATAENMQNELRTAGNGRNRPPAKKKCPSRPAAKRPVEEVSGGKDVVYFEKRKRNNASAKRSRDARKEREESVSRRADFLERENSILKAQVATLREEANSLRQLLSQRPVVPAMITADHRAIATHQL